MPAEDIMIKCSRCKERYHLTCVIDISDILDDLNYVWFCTSCKFDNNSRSKKNNNKNITTIFTYYYYFYVD